MNSTIFLRRSHLGKTASVHGPNSLFCETEIKTTEVKCYYLQEFTVFELEVGTQHKKFVSSKLIISVFPRKNRGYTAKKIHYRHKQQIRSAERNFGFRVTKFLQNKFKLKNTDCTVLVSSLVC